MSPKLNPQHTEWWLSKWECTFIFRISLFYALPLLWLIAESCPVENRSAEAVTYCVLLVLFIPHECVSARHGLDWRSFIFSVCKVDLCVKEFISPSGLIIVRWARQTNSSGMFISDNTFAVNEFHRLEGQNVFIAALYMWHFGLIGLQHWSLSVMILLMSVIVIVSLSRLFTRRLREQVKRAVEELAAVFSVFKNRAGQHTVSF